MSTTHLPWILALLLGATPPTVVEPPESSTPDPHAWHAPAPAMAGGHIMPHLTVVAPGTGVDSEAGIGALVPWADRLWMIGYVSHKRGRGLGLYEVRDDLSWRLHQESVTGTYANRLVHWKSKQAVIGPHVIAEDGTVRTIEPLVSHRLAATANHLTDPDKVYMLTMEGPLFEVHMGTLETTLLCDLVEELDWDQGAYKHFKAAHTAQGRLVVANNTHEDPEDQGRRFGGRLAEWDGEGPWTILERNAFIEVSGKAHLGSGSYYGNTIYAVGWDDASVILRVLHDGEWKRYLLPFGGHSWCHTWNTEWMRIREVETERYLMDAFGIFYDLPALIYGGHLRGLKPISTHVRIVPDMVSWRGMLVLGGNQTDRATGQPQSGPWFGSIDDLFSFGRPSGWGGPWRHDAVKAHEPSDPFLMLGFQRKGLHIIRDGDDGAIAGGLMVTIQIDPLGDGTWVDAGMIEIPWGERAAFHGFPEGFSAHWVRLVPHSDAVLSAQFFYD